MKLLLFRIISILSIAFFSPCDVDCQARLEYVCPLQEMKIFEKTVVDEFSDHRIGITFESICDSVFAITGGIIKSYTKRDKGNNSYTIFTEDNKTVIYLELAKTFLKPGDTVYKGQYIANAVHLKNSNFRVYLIIRKKKHLFTNKEYLNAFKYCLY